MHPAENALGIVWPIQAYPMFEEALRTVLGHTPAEHQQHLGLHDSVLAREVGRSVTALAGRAWRDAAHLDRYSCFASAMQIQAR